MSNFCCEVIASGFLKNMKLSTNVIIIATLIFCFLNETKSQCGCCSAAFSGSALAAGTSNIGVLKEGTLRVIGINRLLYGNRFYDGPDLLKKFYDEEMLINFTGANIGYGLTKSFTLETEIGSFPYKELNFGYTREKISGFSTINVIGKYTLLADRVNKQEITIGGGGRIPLNSNTTLSGNPGVIFQLFYFKNLVDDFNLIFLNRSEIAFKDSENFKQGNSYINSVFLSKGITHKLYSLFEIRFDYLDKSYDGDDELLNSGRYVLSLVPQISYNLGKLSLAGFFELPVLKNYNGIQLGEKFGCGIALVYMTGLQ